MFVNLALSNHQADLLACLDLQPGATQRLHGLRSFLAIGVDLQDAITVDLGRAMVSMTQARDGASYPLERFVLRRSPTFTGNQGPVVARAAIAATLALETRMPGKPPSTSLWALGSSLGMNLPEEKLDFLTKVGFTREALGLSPIDPLRIYFNNDGHLDGRHKSPFSGGILNALEDLDPWRDPAFIPRRPSPPPNHPLNRIIVFGLPALLFHFYYQATDPITGMSVVSQRLAELWDREDGQGKRLSAEGKAYGILSAILARCAATHLDIWGHWPGPLDHLAAAVGGAEPVRLAEDRLGVRLPVAWPLQEEVPV